MPRPPCRRAKVLPTSTPRRWHRLMAIRAAGLLWTAVTLHVRLFSLLFVTCSAQAHDSLPSAHLWPSCIFGESFGQPCRPCWDEAGFILYVSADQSGSWRFIASFVCSVVDTARRLIFSCLLFLSLLGRVMTKLASCFHKRGSLLVRRAHGSCPFLREILACKLPSWYCSWWRELK